MYTWRICMRGEEMGVSVTYSSARTLEVSALDESGAEAAWAGVRCAGQSVRVSFNAITDSSSPSSFFVDDVSLTAG